MTFIHKKFKQYLWYIIKKYIFFISSNKYKITKINSWPVFKQDPKIVSVCPYPEKRNHHSFVNISPTLVIDTSMERSSRVLHHGNPKIKIKFKKVRNSNFDMWRRAEITLVRQYQSYISNWYINRKIFTSTTT